MQCFGHSCSRHLEGLSDRKPCLRLAGASPVAQLTIYLDSIAGSHDINPADLPPRRKKKAKLGHSSLSLMYIPLVPIVSDTQKPASAGTWYATHGSRNDPSFSPATDPSLPHCKGYGNKAWQAL